MMAKPVVTIELPIQPKDVFRLLALRSITDTSGLFEKLNENFKLISDGIKMTSRLDINSFGRHPFRYTHNGLNMKETVFTAMTERQLCAANTAFFARNFPGIGKVLDYEMPLDDKKDSAFGKVDLVSQVNDELLLLEVKKCVSNEHPLRAMFEIFTFWKTLSDECGRFDVFIDAYTESPTYKQRKGNLPKPTKVQPGLLLCKTSDICDNLLSPAKSDKKRDELYKRFLRNPIGLRVFQYDKDRLGVKEVTNMLKERLGII